jgi:hypothetical protein
LSLCRSPILGKRMRKKVREGYRNRLILPEVCHLAKAVAKKDVYFSTKSGTPIAKNYVRVVIGDRGPYIEFTRDQINHDETHVPAEQQYRINHKGCYYIELRSNDDAYVKIYVQKRIVKYADYKIGMYYISPFDLTSNLYPVLIKEKWRV